MAYFSGQCRLFKDIHTFETLTNSMRRSLASPYPLRAQSCSVIAIFFRFQPSLCAQRRDGSVPSGLQTRLPWRCGRCCPGRVQEAIAARAQVGKPTCDKSLNKKNPTALELAGKAAVWAAQANPSRDRRHLRGLTAERCFVWG